MNIITIILVNNKTTCLTKLYSYLLIIREEGFRCIFSQFFYINRTRVVALKSFIYFDIFCKKKLMICDDRKI